MSTNTRAPSTIITIDLTGQTEFTIPFEYLARKYVEVTLLGIDRLPLVLNTDFRFVTKTLISLTQPYTSEYRQIELRRATSATERLVDFHDGSILRAYDLNLAQIQTLHVAEEAKDAVSAYGLALDDTNHYNARGRRITNMAEAIAGSDAITLGQVVGWDNSAYQSASEAAAQAAEAKRVADELKGDLTKLRSWVNPTQYGAVGDGVTDDTAALEAMLASGLPVDWGNHINTYKVTRTISLTPTSGIKWRSSGARIVVQSVNTLESVLKFQSVGVQLCHAMVGELVIDCNHQAQCGLSYKAEDGGLQHPAGYVSFVSEDLTVLNVRKTLQGTQAGFILGDGVSLLGAFEVVAMLRTRVDGVRMEQGAGVYGTHGITGVTVAAIIAKGYPRNVLIEQPSVSNIIAEGADDRVDQDGIRLFTDRRASTNHSKSTFHIVGGTVRNSRNRSVKLQGQMAVIDGLTIIKDSSVDIGGHKTTQNPDVDFQTGGGFVSNLSVHYDGYVGSEVVRFNEDTTERVQMPSLSVRGLYLNVTPETTVAVPVVVKPYSDDTRNQMAVSLMDIECHGRVNTLVETRTASSGGGTSTVDLMSCRAQLEGQLLTALGGGDLRYNVVNCRNTASSAVPLFKGGSRRNQIVSALNTVGFANTGSGVTTGDSDPINGTRVTALLPDEAVDSGIATIRSFTLAAGASIQLPALGLNKGTQMMMIQCARRAVAGGNAVMVAVTNGPSGDVVALTSHPDCKYSLGNKLVDPAGTSGKDYEMWASSELDGGAYLRNNTTASRTFTIWMVG